MDSSAEPASVNVVMSVFGVKHFTEITDRYCLTG